MPVIKAYRDELFAAMGESFTDDEFEKLCFSFGIELDDVTSDRELAEREKGEGAGDDLSDIPVYKIEVPANRYDLLCMESIARALSIFRGKRTNPKYNVVTPDEKSIINFYQTAETKSVRPFASGAVLRDITFTESNYKSFIALQDKLHENIGRHRSLVAIGTHDMDTIQAPFHYQAKPWADIKFAPLGEPTKQYAVPELYEHYRNDENKQHLRPFLKLCEGHPNHPVIVDSKDTVLSLPPLINGDHSKITLNTKNVFIECTGTDWTKLNIALDQIVTTFSEYCGEKYRIERIAVHRPGADAPIHVPLLTHSVFKDVSVDYINHLVGIDWTGEAMAQQLQRMQMPSEYVAETKSITVTAPPVRPDILHKCDIAEDVAITFGYENVKQTIPKVSTIGGEVPLNKLTDLNRCVMAESGFTEVITWVLCNTMDNSSNLNVQDEGKSVKISNPKAREFQVVRTSLISGLLKVVASNLGHVQLPIRIFEAGDVCFLDAKQEVGARNERHMAALYCGSNSGIEEIHALVGRICKQNNCRFIAGSSAEAQAMIDRVANGDTAAVQEDGKQIKKAYFLRESSHDTYMPMRRADVFVEGRKIGQFGIIHPNCLKAYAGKQGLGFPCAAMELNLEYF